MLYTFLSHTFSGLVIACMVGLCGWIVAYTGCRHKSRWLRFAGYGLYGMAGLLLIGGIAAVTRANLMEARYQPMGERLDVGGYRMHILAEGAANGRPTVIWIPGSRAPGLAFYYHHKKIRSETRSILFDRPGTGWSDVGPFPRRTAKEAEELAKLLKKAGEAGPFVVIGHSYGGLLAANFARQNPDRTAALVLLDATTPDSAIYAPNNPGRGISTVVRMAQLQGLFRLFGIEYDPYNALAESNAEFARVRHLYDELLADVQGLLKAGSAGPAYFWSAASVFSELAPDNIARTASNLIVYDGELGHMPVYIVVPDMPPSVDAVRSKAEEAEQKRLLNFQKQVRLRYLRISARSELIFAPAGTGHNFPYEVPEFVLHIVRNIIANGDTMIEGYAINKTL